MKGMRKGIRLASLPCAQSKLTEVWRLGRNLRLCYAAWIDGAASCPDDLVIEDL